MQNFYVIKGVIFMNISKKVSKTIEHKKIEVIFTNERLITPSELAIVGGLLEKSKFVKYARAC